MTAVKLKKKRRIKSDIGMLLSNCSIGAGAPAATFGKTAVFEDV